MSRNTYLATSKDTNEPATWLGEMRGTGKHPEKPDHALRASSALPAAKDLEKLPKMPI